MKHEEINNLLEDPNSKYFAGSYTYLQISFNISLLIKCISVKKRKADKETLNTYNKIVLISKEIQKYADLMVEKDADIFASLYNLKSNEEKDNIVNDIYPKSIAFLENLNTLEIFIYKLIQETKSSLKYDFIFIKDSLNACYNNLIHILIYEVKKHSDIDLVNQKLQQIESLRKE